MQAIAKTVTMAPDSELGLALKAARANGVPVVVDTGENRYTLVVDVTEAPRDDFADYDPQAAIAAFQALDDALAGVDRAALLRDLRAQRVQDSSGRPG